TTTTAPPRPPPPNSSPHRDADRSRRAFAAWADPFVARREGRGSVTVTGRRPRDVSPGRSPHGGAGVEDLEAPGQFLDQRQVVGPAGAAPGAEGERGPTADGEVLTAVVGRGAAALRVHEVQRHPGAAGELGVRRS